MFCYYKWPNKFSDLAQFSIHLIFNSCQRRRRMRTRGKFQRFSSLCLSVVVAGGYLIEWNEINYVDVPKIVIFMFHRPMGFAFDLNLILWLAGWLLLSISLYTLACHAYLSVGGSMDGWVPFCSFLSLSTLLPSTSLSMHHFLVNRKYCVR